VTPGKNINPVKEVISMNESPPTPITEFIKVMLCCPRRDTHDHCPFDESRKLPLNEKINWIMTQSKDDILEKLAFHRNCIRNSEFDLKEF
jgi:hypothetical protein